MMVGQIVNKMPAPHLRRKDDALVDSETLLGVEVEVEGCKKKLPTKDKEAAYWQMKEDHSLRDNGMEFAFSEPLFGMDVVLALKYLFDKANEYGFKISERTGIHVHVDMRGMELDKFQNFCILYALTEPALYRWIGDNRDRNIHCLPWYAADGDLDTIGAIFREPNHGTSYIKSINRYAGLNLNSLIQFGTAEFRHLKTTFDLNRMLDWVNILLSLKKAALAWTGTPAQLIKEMKILRAYGFMHRVFGPQMGKLWYPDFDVKFRGLSLPIAQHLASMSTKMTLSDSNKRFEKHVRNEEDEAGTHPGLTKWKTKLSKRANEKTVKVKKTPLSEQLLVDLATNSVGTWGVHVTPAAPPPQGWDAAEPQPDFDADEFIHDSDEEDNS